MKSSTFGYQKISGNVWCMSYVSIKLIFKNNPKKKLILKKKIPGVVTGVIF